MFDTTQPGSPNPRILLYSHDTVGLGNIRRTLLIAQELFDEIADASILIVTGSPVFHAFPLQEGLDYVKLPALDRISPDHYEARFLTNFSQDVRGLRSEILRVTLRRFDPTLVLVDKRPGGVGGELVGTLEELRARGHAKIVLGMRDILDDPSRAPRLFAPPHDFATIERLYDEVWVYGVREVFDPILEYGFPASVARKTHFCGYLGRNSRCSQRTPGPSRVLVTPGGGQDGASLVEAYLRGLRASADSSSFESTVIFGPYMPKKEKDALRKEFQALRSVSLRDFDATPTALFEAADVVVSMAGYNTVCELLALNKRAVVVPRAEPVKEQLIRACRMASRGILEYVEPDKRQPEALLEKVIYALTQPASPRVNVDLSGLRWIRTRVRTLLGRQLPPQVFDSRYSRSVVHQARSAGRGRHECGVRPVKSSA